ncbi:ENTH domain-containing [Chlorella sorokiniana]|uniref:ENTH domain-containing n=1 Tax=Chlorella sorokiniana TaxID=3076 RepID=A0A2P6TLK2_CHLSO|nr:ENTH domain-containing [Chlorella sorokiniana]|eukprot:PRW45169.1 ENTH domain-containing [Chlorella sorokiniana]
MDKLREVDWRGMVKTATQKVKKYTLNLTDLELKVEDATSAETWGPHGSTMNEIADAAFDPENYRQIMGVLARRLQERDENWRMCYKALLLLEHLIKHGPGKIVGDVQSSASVLERLQYFEYKDANLKDHGVNVRHRAKEILQLVNDPQRLREEREKAKANRAKYRGVSADQMRSSSFAGAGSSSFGRVSHTAGSLQLGGSSFSGGGGGGLSRRTDSYDETEQDSHYISKRTGSTSATAEAPSAGCAGGAGGSGDDPVAATRARIEKLKLSGTVASEDKEAAADHGKKKLTDVRVNPKIAASLGLKIPVQPPPAAARPPAAQPAATAAAAEIDLLGGLEEPAAPAPAPAAPAAAPAFDPFAAPAAPAQQQQQQQPSWDAFGAPAAAAPAAAPLDLLGGLNSPTPAPAALQQPRPAAPVDPFAAMSVPAAPAAPAAAPPKAAAAVAAGVPSALPEDMFSDLTGIGGRAHQPMGNMHGASPRAGSTGGMGGWGAAPMGGAQQSGSFGDFAGGSGFAAAAPAGQPMLPDEFGSFGGTGVQPAQQAQQGAAASSGPDPFADLLK